MAVPASDPAITLRSVALPHGITLSCREAGREGGRRVLFLHGFPEAAFAWDEVMATLASQVHGLAPNQRGFERSSAPEGVAAYRAKHLVADLVALIETTGGPLDLLVAHDWGGAVAWNLAALRPELMRGLVIVNSPHPGTFLRELQSNAAQQAASRYMHFLCRPDAAELLAANDFARLWPFFTGDGGAAWLDEPMRQRYRQAWSCGLRGALNWYAASPLKPPLGADDPLHALQLPPEILHVRVPTTVIWGEADRALLPGLLDGLDKWVPELRLVRVPGASHWIVHEQPATVVREIQRELG
jgi:epoxide hydrolase 4